MIGILGWTGLVGQTLYHQLLRRGISAACYNSKNIQEIRGTTFETLYICCMPAVKWWANAHPDADKATLDAVLEVLDTITADRVFLISTVDVLQSDCKGLEESEAWTTHAYGRHRRALEVWISNKWTAHILRLPALFGRGLKKNALYDLLHENQIAAISLNAQFQWYNLAYLLEDCQWMVKQNLHLLHPVSPPIPMRNIVTRFFPEKLEACVGNAGVLYNIQTKHGELEQYWRNTEEVLGEMGAWIAWEKWRISMRIAASNIGFVMNPDTAASLHHIGINCLEMAPGKGMEFSGFPVVSMQSILFGTPIQNIFWESTAFLEHIRRLLEVVRRRGLRTIVFGSPKQRHLGKTTSSEALEAIDLFRKVGDIAAEFNVTVCIEPNAKGYGCTWLTTIDETFAFVQDVQHPNICLSLDTGNALMEQDAGWKTVDVSCIGHVQVSAEYLGPTLGCAKDWTQKVIESLWERGYKGTISWEAREHQDWWKGCGEFMDVLEGAYLARTSRD